MTWMLLAFLIAREGVAAMPPVEFKREDLCNSAGQAFEAKADATRMMDRAKAVWVCVKQS